MEYKVKNPSIWGEEWFCKLDLIHQLLYMYVYQYADSTGIYHVDLRKFEDVTKTKINNGDFLEQVNEDKKRISLMPDNKWFLHYLLSEQHSHFYHIKNKSLNIRLHQLKTAGVPASWIKGFENFDELKEIYQ